MDVENYKDKKIENDSERDRRNMILTKKDIMDMYSCQSDKALRILKFMFGTGFAFKIGKEYYVTQASHKEFLEYTRGKELFI